MPNLGWTIYVGPYIILVLLNARLKFPLICEPIDQFADKFRQELMSGCILLRPMWFPTILSPFRKKRKIILQGYVGWSAQHEATSIYSAISSAVWRQKIKSPYVVAILEHWEKKNLKYKFTKILDLIK